jgi:hypothetical protein
MVQDGHCNTCMVSWNPFDNKRDGATVGSKGRVTTINNHDEAELMRVAPIKVFVNHFFWSIVFDNRE